MEERLKQQLKQEITGASFVRMQGLSLRMEDEDKDELTFSFSSELPCERWWGTEVLLHTEEAADLSRLNDGGQWLFNHNRDFYIGVCRKAWIDATDKRAYVTTKWSNADHVKPIRQDVKDGILKNVSFAYDIGDWIPAGEDGIIVTRWPAFEVSIVTVPADPTVGIGRAQDGDRPLIWGVEPPMGREKPKEQTPRSFDPIVIRERRENVGMEPEEILQQERDRVAQIRAIGAEHNCPELVQKFELGGSVEEFRAAVLNEMKERANTALSRTTPVLGLSKKESERYSVLRAMLAAATGDWSKAGLEKECHTALENVRGKEAGGQHSFYMPHFDLTIDSTKAQQQRSALGLQERTTYQVGTSNVGGVTVETSIYPEMIDYLRNVPLVMQFGARMWTGLEGNLDVLRQLTFTNVGWIGEDESLPEGNATFGSFQIRPRDVGAWSRVTRRMLQQSSIDIEMFVREELILGIALELDRVVIHGSGTGNEPRGILNTPGIGSVALGTNGGVPTWASIVDLETQVATQNALMSNVAYMTTPKARGKLKTTLKASAAGSDFIWADAGIMTPSGNLGTLNGYLAGATNQVRSDLTKGTSGATLSAMVFGNWREVITAFWDGLKVDMNPYADADFLRDAMKIRCIQTSDVQVGRPIAFACTTDMITA